MAIIWFYIYMIYADESMRYDILHVHVDGIVKSLSGNNQNVIHSRREAASSCVVFFLLHTCSFQEEPFWCPTDLVTPTQTYNFPLPEGKGIFENGMGLTYEIQNVRQCLVKGI